MITYTTAPRDYDWGWTRELDGCAATDKRGRPVRKVVTIEGRGELQRDRYGSGLHMAVDDVEFLKLVDCRLVEPGDERERARARGLGVSSRGFCTSCGASCPPGNDCPRCGLGPLVESAS